MHAQAIQAAVSLSVCMNSQNSVIKKARDAISGIHNAVYSTQLMFKLNYVCLACLPRSSNI